MLTSATWEMRRTESAHAIRGAGETLQLLGTDTGAWVIERAPDGAAWRPGTQEADVQVSGPAASLLLALTRRLPLAEAPGVSVTGDAALVQHWIDNTRHVDG